jgi:branched-chain amino acid transport system substrate-binding protein
MAQPKEIILGAALPITGGQSREGGYFKKGYEMAIKEINDAGGVMVKQYGKKIPIKLITYDDKSDNTTSVQLYEKLVAEDKVNALLGGYGTPLITAHTVVAEKYRVPYVNGGGATGAIYERKMKHIFGLLASIEKLSFTLMDWTAGQQDAGALKKPLRIALMGENTSHGKEFREGVFKRAKATPDRFQVVMDEPFEINMKDADPLLQKAKASQADIYLADARLADYTTIHRRYTELRLYHQMVSYGPRGTEKAARDALGVASDYIVSCNWWHRDIPTAAAKTFRDKFEKTYNEPAEWFPALAYETARVMAKAIEDAGTLDKAKIRDALAKMDMKNSLVVGGRVWFKPNGQIDNEYVMMQNLPGGKVALIYPKDIATAKAIVPIPQK